MNQQDPGPGSAETGTGTGAETESAAETGTETGTGTETESAAETGAEAAERAERRRRLDAIFGDVLPETTADERSPGRASRPSSEESSSDRWLRDQVPPHHGG